MCALCVTTCTFSLQKKLFTLYECVKWAIEIYYEIFFVIKLKLLNLLLRSLANTWWTFWIIKFFLGFCLRQFELNFKEFFFITKSRATSIYSWSIQFTAIHSILGTRRAKDVGWVVVLVSGRNILHLIIEMNIVECVLLYLYTVLNRILINNFLKMKLFNNVAFLEFYIGRNLKKVTENVCGY